MNIVILSDAAAFVGGAEKVALTSAIGLARRGHAVKILSPVGPIDPKLLAEPNIETTCLNQGSITDWKTRLEFHRNRLWNVPAIAALKDILSQLDPKETVIHAHCFYGNLSSGVVDVALKSGCPFVATMHDYSVACPQRTFFHYSENAICHRKPLSLSCICTNCTTTFYRRKVSALLLFFVQDKISRIGDRLPNLIFVSEFSRKILEPFLNPKARGFHVRNPLDVEKCPRAPVERNNEHLFIGRMVQEKDPITLALAAKKAGVKAVFIGDGAEIDRVREANPDAEFCGWLDAEAIHARLEKARSFVLPSIWYETGAPVMSMIEAQAHGVPSIVSDLNSSSDCVEDGVTGFRYEGGNVDALAEKLEAMKVDRMAQAMSEETYNRFWADPPTVDMHVDRLLEVYAQIRETDGA